MTYREDGALLDAYAGLYNMQTGAGTSRDKNLNFEINYQAETLGREQAEVLFKTSGLVQKIVALLPEESPIEWYSLNLGKDTTAPQDVINDLEDRLQLHEKLVEASVLARLHHNAYIVIFANDGKLPSEPLDEGNLQEITTLKVLSSYELQPSNWGLELGGHALIEPEYYDLIGLWELNKRLPEEQKFPVAQTQIHKSRVLKFSGRKLYGWMLQRNQGRDLSILQSIVIAFSSYMQSIMASSGMVQDYSVFTYKLKGLADLILQGQSDAIIRRFLAIQMGMSYNKGLAMDAENEEAQFVQRSYGGVGDIVDRLKHLLTAESGIPHTKLWGEGSQGNTSGQSEKYDYADALESFQRHNWLKPTKYLVRLALLSKTGVTKGKLPKGWKLVTKSSIRLDMEAEAKLRQTQARTDQVYRLMGVLHPLEIRKNRFGSPEWTMETTLDPEIDKILWEMKENPEFVLPVLSGKPTGQPTSNPNEKIGAASTGVDAGTKMGQAAIAGMGGDGGNNAEMEAQEADRERMAENRRTDEKSLRYDGSTVKKRLKWGDRILAIEFLPGDIRHGLPMQGVYGYIQKHTGHDNQPLDFYATTEFYELLSAGEQPKGKIFEIYQLKANADDPLERKSLDETKVLLGCDSLQEAAELYLAHMPEEFLGLINDLTPEELRHYRYRRDEWIEDAKWGKSKSAAPDAPSVSKRKVGYDPSQKRGKDGRWVETGAEGRNKTERNWSSAQKSLDKKKGIQAIQSTPQQAKDEQESSSTKADKFDKDKIEKNWGVKDRDEVAKLSEEMDKLSEKWEEKNPDDPFGIYDDPEYNKLSEKVDEINEKLDKDPNRSRKLSLYKNLEEFRKQPNLKVEPIYAAVINDYMRGGYQDINKALRSPESFDPKAKLDALKLESEMLSRSLKELPDYKGTVHRGTDVMALNFFKDLKPGDTFRDKGFMSTNRTDRDAKPWDAPIQLTINSKTGKSIKEFGDKRYTTENKKEDEVLFLPNTPFKVKSREEKNGRLFFELDET